MLQQLLVRSLSEAGVAALGLAAGIHLEHAPPALRKAADEHNLPLFEVAYEVPFRTITSYIITSLVSTDMHRLRRSLSVQNHLLSLLVEEKGADHLVSSLSMLLNVTVILFDGRGAVLSQAQHRVHVDSEQGNMIWQTYQEVAAAGEIPKEVNWGELHLAFREVTYRGRVHQVLALAIPIRDHLTEFADVVLTYAQKLLSLELLKSRDVLLVERKRRSDLLEELLTETPHTRNIAEHLRSLEFEPDRTMIVAACGPADSDTTLDGDDLQDAVERTLAEMRLPAIALFREDRMLILFQLEDCAQDALLEFGNHLQTRVTQFIPSSEITVGMSTPYRDPMATLRGYTQALEAARAAATGNHPAVVLFPTLGPSIRSLEDRPEDQLFLFYDSTVGPLEEHDAENGDTLMNTLQVYLEEQRSTGRASERLYIHPNTLRYRLAKIEEILGIELDDTEKLVDVFLGLRSRNILRDRNKSRET